MKEFKEFFIREVKVFTGSKADQELNFPTTNVVKTCNGKETKFNRLLSQHYASDEVIRKFVESITFKLNPEDTAHEEEQGLSLMATDEQAATNVVETTDFTRTLQSHQLPKFITSSATSLPVKYYDLITGIYHNTIAAAKATGNPFVIAHVVDGNGSGGLLYAECNYPPVQYANNSGNALKHGVVTIEPSVHLNNDGDIINYNIFIEAITSSESQMTAVLYMNDGATETALFSHSDVNAYSDLVNVQLRKTGTNLQSSVLINGSTHTVAYATLPLTTTFELYYKFTTLNINSIISVVNVDVESKVQ